MSKEDKNKEAKTGSGDNKPAPTKPVEDSTAPAKKRQLTVANKPVFPKGPGVFIRTGKETFDEVKPAQSSGEKPGEK